MSYGLRSKLQRFSSDADQAEFNALLDMNAAIDSAIEDDKIAGTIYDEMDELENFSDEEWMREDQGKDELVGQVAEHIQWRQDILKDFYPFEYQGNHLTLKENPSPVYLFCLCVSLANNLTSGDNVKLPRYFELMAGKLFTKFFSSHAKHLHTGWPRSDGNPKSYKELAEKLNKSISSNTIEWSWKVQHGLKDEDAIRIKDCGVDFVSWVDFLDERDGRLFALGQCACGNDWPTKFNDIKIAKLNPWFHPLTFTKCIKVFSTPYILVNEMMREASSEAGVVFDRVRLTIAYEKFKSEFLDMPHDLNGLIDLCKNSK
ncbi:hypothetical protein [Buttiauxella sp. S19-1]|uniref:hypothetical protein n=1 Tax=Buttiauxella sp. S19-1 TaxID=941430 RepID=UPI001ED9EE76|nr:hypothetical protein [Buttiauxella sp. S19-1]